MLIIGKKKEFGYISVSGMNREVRCQQFYLVILFFFVMTNRNSMPEQAIVLPLFSKVNVKLKQSQMSN